MAENRLDDEHGDDETAKTLGCKKDPEDEASMRETMGRLRKYYEHLCGHTTIGGIGRMAREAACTKTRSIPSAIRILVLERFFSARRNIRLYIFHPNCTSNNSLKLCDDIPYRYGKWRFPIFGMIHYPRKSFIHQ